MGAITSALWNSDETSFSSQMHDTELPRALHMHIHYIGRPGEHTIEYVTLGRGSKDVVAELSMLLPSKLKDKMTFRRVKRDTERLVQIIKMLEEHLRRSRKAYVDMLHVNGQNVTVMCWIDPSSSIGSVLDTILGVTGVAASPLLTIQPITREYSRLVQMLYDQATFLTNDYVSGNNIDSINDVYTIYLHRDSPSEQEGIIRHNILSWLNSYVVIRKAHTLRPSTVRAIREHFERSSFDIQDMYIQQSNILICICKSSAQIRKEDVTSRIAHEFSQAFPHLVHIITFQFSWKESTALYRKKSSVNKLETIKEQEVPHLPCSDTQETAISVSVQNGRHEHDTEELGIENRDRHCQSVCRDTDTERQASEHSDGTRGDESRDGEHIEANANASVTYREIDSTING